MFCQKCGNKINDNAMFCNKCGNKTNTSKIEESDLQQSDNENIIDNSNINEIKEDKVDKNNTDFATEGRYTQDTDNNVNTDISKPTQVVTNNEPNTNQNKGKNKKFMIFGVVGIFVTIVLVLLLGSSIGGTDDIDLSQTYTDEKEGLSFNYPKKWKEPEIKNDKSLIELVQSSKTNMSVYKNYVSSDESLSMDDEYFIQNYADKGIEIQEIYDTKIDGISVKKILYSFNQGPDYFKGIQYMYIIDSDMYTVTFVSLYDDFDKYESVFDAVMRTYTITREPQEVAEQETEIETQTETKTKEKEVTGISEKQALQIAENYIDTHPLYERAVTGEVEYEPANYSYSTKGLYRIALIDNTGANRSMWVEKSSGDVFISLDGSTLLDGEEFYEELALNSQNNNEILFNGIEIANYLDSRPKYLYDDFGQPNYGTEVDGSLYEGGKYMGYYGITFIIDDNQSTIMYIIGEPEMFTFNGSTLNKNRDELVQILGEPGFEEMAYDTMEGEYIYYMTYYMDYYTVTFWIPGSEYDDANKMIFSY